MPALGGELKGLLPVNTPEVSARSQGESLEWLCRATMRSFFSCAWEQVWSILLGVSRLCVARRARECVMFVACSKLYLLEERYRSRDVIESRFSVGLGQAQQGQVCRGTCVQVTARGC